MLDFQVSLETAEESQSRCNPRNESNSSKKQHLSQALSAQSTNMKVGTLICPPSLQETMSILFFLNKCFQLGFLSIEEMG